jgi:hypothetical protein
MNPLIAAASVIAAGLAVEALKGRMNLEVLMGTNSIHSKRDT